MGYKNWLKLIVAIAASQLAGIIGSVFTTTNIDSWYRTLTKPELAPPNWVFGPVWITLYFLMGIAAFLVWKTGFEKQEVKTALTVFIIQLILNTLWSIIFFGMRSPGGGLIVIALLWIMILITMITFFRVSRPTAWLLLPYLAWVSFASYLNYMIYALN